MEYNRLSEREREREVIGRVREHFRPILSGREYIFKHFSFSLNRFRRSPVILVLPRDFFFLVTGVSYMGTPVYKLTTTH